MPKHPQKKYYRQRAHSNPMADHSFIYPVCPNELNIKLLYPNYNEERKIEFADIGCGYGGLLVALSTVYPSTLMLGMEIRVKVSDYVCDRIKSLRESNAENRSYDNIACMRINAMKYLPNIFCKGQLSKIFFLFPDPHFKKSKHKWRIVNTILIAEYAYVLKEGGLIYTLTDVEDLHNWMKHYLTIHPLFQPVPEEDLKSDPIIKILYEGTEEGQKVSRNNGEKHLAVFRRITDCYIR